MAFDSNFFLKKTLGEDFFESLAKFELWKPGTRTTVDHEEIKTALQIVPRALMSFIIHHLSSMEIGGTKELELPIDVKATLIRVNKHERDVYSGEIEQDNKKVVDFKYRSIPGVALVIMSAFELYDTSKLVEAQESAPADDVNKKVQSLIDERLALHDLIDKVVDKKIEQKDAIKQLLLEKLTQELKASKEEQVYKDKAATEVVSKLVDDNQALRNENEVLKKKISPLKDFLEKKKDKSKPKPIEFEVEMVKGETVRCPDCNNALISGEIFTGCICLGEDMDKRVYIKKTEDGVKIRFGRGWDVENIEMLLEVLRRKNG